MPDILARADMLADVDVPQRLSWVLSSAVPYIFLEGIDRGVVAPQRTGYRLETGNQARAGQQGGLLSPTLSRVSSPQEGVACLKRAAEELGMSLPKVDFIRFKEYASGEYGFRRYRPEEYICAPKPSLIQCLRGRQIADDEVLRLARESGCTEVEIWDFLQREVAEGRGVWMAAVGRKRWGWGMECRRCGCRRVAGWPGYYGQGFSCEECMALGGMSSLNVLWRCNQSTPYGHERSYGREHAYEDMALSRGETESVLSMPFTLSEAQQRASLELERSQSSKVLVWAACGAGKTEVCFARIAQVLQEGKRVLFAAPRRDVIHDIAPRLEAAFPHVDRSMLSGASPERFAGGQLVAATTHQVLRFYRAFDLIVLDELDAFPFTEGDLLRRAVDQALRPGGHMICLTATPDAQILRAVRTRRWGLIQLAARFHRKPLPVPAWQKCCLPSEEALGQGARDEAGIMEVLERLSAKGITLFFVPRVTDVPVWRERLCSWLPHKSVCGSWGNDPDRLSKIQELRTGGYDIFVTTTILERGITLDRAQVVVYGADHPLFDERTLVQMAGRAGRKRENPNGEVVFLAGHRSRAMTKAERWILNQNTLARRQGLIDGCYPREKSKNK